MEDLRQTALAYYHAAPEEIKALVEIFKKEMDPKRNDHVEFKEFSMYMEELGCGHMATDEFFEELKHPGNDVLYQDDIITLFYIIHSARPFCGGLCKKFVKGMYFTCVECFDDHTIDSPFRVCCQCFDEKKYEHCHDDFLDLIAHLQYMRMKVLSKARGSNLNEPKYHRSTSSVTPVLNDPSASSSSSQSDKPTETNNSLSSAIVPAANRESKQTKMQTLIQFGQLLAGIGTIVAATTCTIQ